MREDSYFPKEFSEAGKMYIVGNIIKMLELLSDYIFEGTLVW